MSDSGKRSPIRFPPPEESHRSVEREPVDRDCPECGSGDVARYPILRYKGWRSVTRCQDCLHVLKEELTRMYGFWEPWTMEENSERL